jgi:hypothetical protein
MTKAGGLPAKRNKSLTCGRVSLFLVAAHWNWLPPPDPWMSLLAGAGLLLFGCLWFMSFLTEVVRAYLADLKGYRLVEVEPRLHEDGR